MQLKQANYAIALQLQEQMARANAIAALSPAVNQTALQLKLAEEVKQAAMKAINSHTLTLQGLIDAWNVVGQANQTLAGHVGGAPYTDFNSIAATAGLGLTHAQRVALEERYSQSAEHGGKIPTGPAALGIGLGPIGTKGPTDRYSEPPAKQQPRKRRKQRLRVKPLKQKLPGKQPSRHRTSRRSTWANPSLQPNC